MEELVFLSAKQIKEKWEKEKLQVVIWGTGHITEEVENTLNAIGVDIYGYGDNNPQKWERKRNGKSIMSPETVSRLMSVLVVIASFGYVPIYNSLINAGINNVIGLKDSFKYDYSELIKDNVIARTSWTGNRNKILLEIYGNIGDTILFFGIVKDFIKKFGKENVWILIETKANAEVYYYLTNNIFVFSADDCKTKKEERMQLIRRMNNVGFSKSIALSDIRLFAVRRWINEYNLIDVPVTCGETVPFKEYLMDIGEEFASVQLAMDFVTKAKSCLNKFELPDWTHVLTSKEKELIVRKKMVAIHMGATKAIRMYDVAKTVQILQFILRKGYLPVIIGRGDDESLFWDEVFSKCNIMQEIIYLVSRLSVVQSMHVIKDAVFFCGTESGMWNISFLLDKPSVVIYGGGDYGNFMHKDSKIHYVTVANQDCFNCKWYCNNLDIDGHAKCIYEISAESIINEIDKLIEQSETLLS